MEQPELLTIRDLQIDLTARRGTMRVLRGVSLTVREREIVAVVGESGCGKSITAHAVMGLNPVPMTRVIGGSINLCGHEITHADERELQALRGTLAGMVFQDHMTGLNPTMPIGKQLTEVLLRRKLLPRAACPAQAIRLLESVQISDAARRIRQYPHEFSGGMRQRVMIAMALVLNPRLLIADEPTTALDATVQAQILSLLHQIRVERGTSVLLITHDLGVVAHLADRVVVMYAGRIVEESDVAALFHHPAHPYTQALLAGIPLYFQPERQVLRTIPGAPPDWYDLPPGCAFAPRCTRRTAHCEHGEPPTFTVAPGHSAACWRLAEPD